MRLLTLLLTIVFTVACADDSARSFGDAPDANGTGGSAGAPRRGDAGGAGGLGETGGAGGSTCGSDADCGPCRTCDAGSCIDAPDGQRCGASTCDGVQPYVGQNGRMAANHVCKTGACTSVEQDCRAAFCTEGVHGCPAGMGVCTNVSEDANAPTACACLQNPVQIDSCPAVRR